MENKELNFYEKIIKIQKELKAPKDKRNNFGNYDYRSCEGILEAVKPLIHEAGLLMIITDSILVENGRNYVKSKILISDGYKEISVEALAREEEVKKGMDGSQITGASSSYARKYALNGLFLIDDAKDSDATNDHGKNVDTPSFSKPPFTSSDFMKFCEWCQSGVSQEEIEKTAKTIYVKKTVSKEQDIEIKDFINNLFKNKDVK